MELKDTTRVSEINIKTTAAVVLTVAINLFAAWLLDSRANVGETLSFVTLVIVGMVIALNVGRFLVWGWIHKRISLAKSYPMTAIFFPIIAIISYLQGDEISLFQWFGIGLITLGVIWITLFVPDNVNA